MAADAIAGRFVLCDPLASGSTGTVWRAWDLRERRFCAAKVLRQRDSGDLIRFTREQSVRLAHPHILTPYAWVAEDAHVLIASDLATGGSGTTLLGDWGPLASPTVADVLDQLLDALEHVHEVGFVHRDVKLGNVLFDAGPGRLRIRLADFGIAVHDSDARLTQQGMVVGTLGYLSPEARAGSPPHAAQDLYAAGQCALALLTGTEPSTSGDVPDLTGIPGPVGPVIAALLDPSSNRRPPSAAAARAMLVAQPVPMPLAQSGELVVVVDQLPPLPAGWSPGGPSDDADAARRIASEPGPPGSSPVHRPRAPRRRAVVAAIVALLVLAGGGAWLATRPSGDSNADQRQPATTSSPPVAGAICTWQQEGDEVANAAGTVRCTRAGTNFTWVRV